MIHANKYCPACGGELKRAFADNRERDICSRCSRVHYINPLPVVACLVSGEDGTVLLIKRGVEPCLGRWALPGGFIEIDESPILAGKRELLEETGISGVPGRLIGVERHDSPLYGPLILIGIEYTSADLETSPGDDAQDARFFPADDLPDIPFSSHETLIRSFISMSN